MRILHIGKFYAPFRGGVETYLQDAIKALAGRGHACLALVHNHDRGLRTRREHFGETQPDSAPWQVVRSATWTTAFFTPVSPGFRGDLKRLIRDFRPDVIHIHLPNPSAGWLLTIRSSRDVPLVIHWHSDVLTQQQGPIMRLLYRFYGPLEHRLLKRADAIIATSRPYLESSTALQDFTDKCHVVPLGLDPGRIKADVTPDSPSTGDKFQILAIGRLTYYKGFGILISAMKDLPQSKLTIVGQGSMHAQLSRLAHETGVTERVHFAGGVDDDTLHAHLQACDCVCLPSTERTEAFGLALLEAMAFAKPAVVSRLSGSGMSWVVEDGVTGLHAEPGDATSLAAALETLRLDPALAKKLGRAGQRRFEETFSIGTSVESLLEIYASVAPQAKTA